MNQLTFFDKIQVLFKLLFSSPIIIGIFVFSMILMILLFFSSKLNKKIIKYIFIFVYVGIIGFSIIKYGSYFLTSIDSFLTLFMANIYFPIIPIYVAIMIISFIIMIVTLSKNKTRFIKIINIVFFTLIQMLFALFIYVVEVDNIDLSTNTSLYTNEQTMTLLELGMGLFFVWVLILLVIFYLKKADKIFKSKKTEEHEDFDEYINDYNEPMKSDDSLNVVTPNFNKSIVQSLVPEFNDNVNDEVLSFDESLNNSKSLNDSENKIDAIPDNVFNSNALNNFDNTFNSVENDLDMSSNSVNISNDNAFSQFNNLSSNFDNSLNDINSSNSFINSSNNVSNSDNVSDIFGNFQFLDTNPVERKNDDIEIIDLDIQMLR